MRKVAHIMGMPISVDIPGEAPPAAAFRAVFAELRRIDRQFSPYKPDSELMRFRAGELKEAELSDEMQTVMHACEQWAACTNGYFSAYFKGEFDPTGYVKGWAIARAGELLAEQGINTFLINAAGDILARSAGGHKWRIGLEHPQGGRATIGTITTGNVAVATSGTHARGQHILDPHTQKPATELLSVTVRGPNIITADVLATALFAMGPQKALEFMRIQPGYEALLVDTTLRARMTPGFSTQTVQ